MTPGLNLGFTRFVVYALLWARQKFCQCKPRMPKTNFETRVIGSIDNLNNIIKKMQ